MSPLPVRVEMKGFSSQVRNNIDLQVEQVARLDFAMQVGNVAETIEVAGERPTDRGLSLLLFALRTRELSLIDQPLLEESVFELLAIIGSELKAVRVAPAVRAPASPSRTPGAWRSEGQAATLDRSIRIRAQVAPPPFSDRSDG